MRCLFVLIFVEQCEVLVCLDFGHFFFFPLATKLIGPRTGCQFFEKMSFFFDTRPLKGLKFFRFWDKFSLCCVAECLFVRLSLCIF